MIKFNSKLDDKCMLADIRVENVHLMIESNHINIRLTMFNMGHDINK